MATYTKLKLSGSTDGKPVKIAATATAGTTVHTAHATSLDELWIWLTNTDSSDRTVTVEFGGVTSPDCLILKTVTIPALSPPIPVVTGQILTNSLVVGIFASAANVVLATGYVNRIT